MVGAAVYAVMYPFDVIKTQLQMRNEFIKERQKWRLKHRRMYLTEVMSNLRIMARREHFRMIRVGITPIFFLGLFATVVRNSTYQYAYHNAFLSNNRQDVLQPRAILFCGIVGTISQLIMNPFNIMKTKLQYWVMCENTDTNKAMKGINMFKIGKILYKKLGVSIHYSQFFVIKI